MWLLLYGALGYWGLCAAVSIATTLLCPNSPMKQGFLRDVPSPRQEIWYALTTLVVALMSPLLVPSCLISAFLEHRRETALHKWLTRTHRENVYESVQPADLPKRARRYFDERAIELLAVGFREIGRYLLKPEPAPSLGYCFQSRDGRTLGVLGHMFDDTYLSFSTLFANGLLLETGSVEETPNLARFNSSTTYRVVFAPGKSIAESFARHEQEIADIEIRMNTRALSFEPDQFSEVLTYEGRVFSQLLYELGELDAPPPPAILPDSTSNESASVAAYEYGDSEYVSTAP